MHWCRSLGLLNYIRVWHDNSGKGASASWFLKYIMAVVSIFFIIVRGIEFGDLKCQKWLTSLLSSFFSSILVVQPLKVSSLDVEAENTFITLDCGPGNMLRSVLSSERQGEGQGGSGVHR